ncbi:pyridoxamine 5'-phosphate oxidase family protein [Lacrimispora algidixylanolytica]|uniref:NimC/NimA family protein n=1 Tax=Lacrimispora algidixylanolytica TaxID=94868 RepID=A0A419TCZ2_9FIRM|nr:pyridoxamine 5'-phosphate oxidase family protein [Lacrimispora algidixylanolytica]RKD35338.1 NimC/NimA family protein [Lacrimispora algidixylanolytica]
MEEVLKYLKECGTFYLATMDGDQPRVRPFGAVCAYEGKIYTMTGNRKPVYQQMLKNPKIEISGMNKGTFIRLECEVVPDDRREVRVAMMEEYPGSLSKMYSVDDKIMEVLYLKNVKATINTLTGESKVIEF